MRGEDSKQEAMFSYISPEKRVPAEHPLRPIRAMVDTVLREMSPRLARLYSHVGRTRTGLKLVAEAILQVGPGEHLKRKNSAALT